MKREKTEYGETVKDEETDPNAEASMETEMIHKERQTEIGRKRGGRKRERERAAGGWGRGKKGQEEGESHNEKEETDGNRK